MVNTDAVIGEGECADDNAGILIEGITVCFAQQLFLIEGSIVAEIIVKVSVTTNERLTRGKNVRRKNTQCAVFCQN